MTGFYTKIQELTDTMRTSLWLLPAIMVSAGIALSFFLLWVDNNYAPFVNEHLSWLFSGTPSAARSLLATIASAVITVVSIAFSLTIVAMQQASSQYTPRLLRTFMANRGNQVVLGAYLATFVYSLMILRAIREEDGSVVAFVPSVAASTAILLALICVGLLIYFINHIATSLQATTVISRVHSELLEQINKLYPEKIGQPVEDDAVSEKQDESIHTVVITSKQTGFVIHISASELEKIDFGVIDMVHILAKVGDFIVYGQPIAEIRSTKTAPTLSESVDEKVRLAIAVTHQRSINQDPLYAVRQLVDTALKGLSPGINDMTTADYCIRYLGDALGRLANRTFPPEMRRLPNGGILHLEKPDWDEFVQGSFNQILHASDGHEQVLHVILRTLQRLGEQLPTQERTLPIRRLLDCFNEMLDHGSYLPSDKHTFQSEIRNLRKLLDRVPLE
ncbi:MAG TPA: DUF2254 domain-containing protein [Candidatus Nitrosotenuis sp.]|nr:DUF2254 domain-containing protein [Candidatus Nitrosotenuis sp.]